MYGSFDGINIPTKYLGILMPAPFLARDLIYMNFQIMFFLCYLEQCALHFYANLVLKILKIGKVPSVGRIL